MSDVGAVTAADICEQFKDRVREKGITDPADLPPKLQGPYRGLLRGDETLKLGTNPSVILVYRGKRRRQNHHHRQAFANLKAAGRSVMLGAADTFLPPHRPAGRVAERAGVPMIPTARQRPCRRSVRYHLRRQSEGIDVVICDTAGRLHNKKNLMDD
jgi:fused signal recognition particle receptor